MVAGCVWLWVVAPLFFVLCVVEEGEVCAIKCTQAQPEHIGDCQKALHKMRTIMALYQGLHAAEIKEKRMLLCLGPRLYIKPANYLGF